MGYIFTNHALSPLTRVNDPLANSLSVTVPRWVDFLTMRFGFHVEHHLFPWMSSRHAPLVRKLILERWPERYQSMPLWRALLAVHRSPRVYVDDRTLLDPETGRRVPTLAARVAPSRSTTRSTPPQKPQRPPRAA
jgi:fatty acid desaturase